MSERFEGAAASVPASFGSPRASLRSRLLPVDPVEMRLRNRAYRSPASRLPDGRFLVFQDSGRFRPAGELECEVEGQPGAPGFALAVDSLSVLEPRLHGTEAFIPSPTCTALVEHALAPVLDLIESLLGRAVNCRDFTRVAWHRGPAKAGPRPELRLGFAILSPQGARQARGWLRADTAFWHDLDFSRMPEPSADRHRALALRLSVQLGTCRLAHSLLVALQTGDALRLTPRPPRGRPELPVRLVHGSGRLGAHAHLAGDRLTLETPIEPLMDASSFPAATAAVPAAPARGDRHLAASIECELTFELGSLRMTLAEIGRLRAGQTLRLGVHLEEQPVTLLAGGRPIGRGELAALGDELVVVVTQTDGLPDV